MSSNGFGWRENRDAAFNMLKEIEAEFIACDKFREIHQNIRTVLNVFMSDMKTKGNDDVVEQLREAFQKIGLMDEGGHWKLIF